jgi:pyruvate kinase
MIQRRPVQTRVLATLGPATCSESIIEQLVAVGADAFRLNFSHSTRESVEPIVQAVRQVSRRLRVHCAIVGDLGGPKIRLGQLAENQEGRLFVPGEELLIIRQMQVGEGNRVGTNYPQIVDEVEVGQRLLIDDGAVRFLVAEKWPDAVVCRCTAAGPIHSRKGVNLPDTTLSVPALTTEDERWVEWSLAHELDYLGMSFVRRGADVQQLRGLVTGAANQPHIIAKIEHPQALQNLDAIIDASDAVMIARGDLGVEVDLAQVPVIQKDIISRCAAAQKPVIVATQMLQSMIDAPRPTRAEVSDVANAIYDGADVLMLSGETAVGAHPLVTVHTMNHIADVTESHLWTLAGDTAMSVSRDPSYTQEMALAQGACRIARSLGARAIVVLSRGGATARLFAKLRPHVPVLAVSSDAAMLRRTSLYFGVSALQMAVPASMDDLLPVLDAHLMEQGGLGQGEPILVVGGLAVGRPRRSNAVMVHHVGERGNGR